MRRPEIRVTNLIPYHPYTNRDPTSEEIKAFERYLIDEIKRGQYKVIVPMGAIAVRWFLGYHHDLHTVHGLPHTSRKAPDAIILPSYHPAAGLHNNETIQFIAYDFQQIQLALREDLPPLSVDEFPDPVHAYIELFTADGVFQALNGITWIDIGLDTEGYKRHPWGLSFSVDSGVAYVIRASNISALSAFNEFIDSHNIIVILHHALHDLPILRELGVHVRRFEDTMVYAHCLCLEPQGLKDLAYRHCGMRMRSYEDVIGPAMQKATTEYLLKVASGDWGLDPPVPERESDMEIHYRQPQALHKRATAAINDIFGLWTGTVIGQKRGGSAKLKEIGVRVGKVNHNIFQQENLPKDFNAWFVEVPIPVKPKLDALYGEYIFDLKEPVLPEKPADAVKRWKSMAEDLEESVERAEKAIGTLPEVGLDAIEDQSIAVNYSARDADATRRIHGILRQRIEAAGMTALAELDMAVLPYVDRMKTVGILINKQHMLDYGEQLRTEMRQIQEKLKQDLGFWINPSSSPQVAMLIYDILGFPVETWTEKGQPSTNDKVLESLSPLHPNIKDVTDYRELHKLRSTYALKLARWMDESGRLHPTWKATRVTSGRLSSSNPNLMAIPVRSERGNAIRRGFISAPGMVFLGVDLSQIEMRILAHLSQDRNLLALFNEGRDFHSATAAFMWKTSIEEIEAEDRILGGASRRSSGKNVSFGIVYGITAKGLQAQIKSKTHQDWSEQECQRMIDLWLETAYPRVMWYMEQQKHLCRQQGYVTTMLGRRRYLPGVYSSIPRVREDAHRQAINHPIQGSASEIIKSAERTIWHDILPMLWSDNIQIQPVLQAHDELVFEVEKSAAAECAEIIIDSMTNSMSLSIPVTAKHRISRTADDGGSWADLK